MSKGPESWPVAAPDRLTLYGSFTSSSTFKPMMFLSLSGLEESPSFAPASPRCPMWRGLRLRRRAPRGRRCSRLSLRVKTKRD